MVDTNLLIYAHDSRDLFKRERSQQLIRELAEKDAFIVSAQILNEFYVGLTRLNRPPSLTHEEASHKIEAIVNTATVLPLDYEITLLALQAVGRYGMAFWDALIWATARMNRIETIYTEDMPGMSVIGGYAWNVRH